MKKKGKEEDWQKANGSRRVRMREDPRESQERRITLLTSVCSKSGIPTGLQFPCIPVMTRLHNSQLLIFFPPPKEAILHWRRKWQPTPAFLPGESRVRGSLVGCRLWRAAHLASIRQMSGQVSRGSSGEYQADERAGVARLRWRVSGR